MKTLFLVPKNILFLLSKGSTYNITEITRELKSSYAAVWKTINYLEKEGMLIKEKVGREMYIKLTKEGIDVSNKLQDIFE